MVYIELKEGYDFEQVARNIKEDAYFAKDDTRVSQVADVESLLDMGHGVEIVRKGVAGKTHNQNFEFSMKINNPAVTAQVLVSSARASMRQLPGAYTMIEMPMIDYLDGEREEIIGRLV